MALLRRPSGEGSLCQKRDDEIPVGGHVSSERFAVHLQGPLRDNMAGLAVAPAAVATLRFRAALTLQRRNRSESWPCAGPGVRNTMP